MKKLIPALLSLVVAARADAQYAAPDPAGSGRPPTASMAAVPSTSASQKTKNQRGIDRA